MTRAKISEYSATAGDNTDVNGVDIAEGCPPSSMNNMGREIMAALKRFQVGSDGDGVTVGGSLVVSGATTLTTVSATVVQSDTVSEKTSAAGVTVDGVLLKDNGASLGGNLTFTGTGNRITGDFSDATVANRVAFQSSTTNGFTNVTAIPNGTGIACSFQACSTSDTTNCARGDIAIVDGQYFRLYTDKVGTGTALPIAFFTNAAERMRIDSSGRLLFATTTVGGNGLSFFTPAAGNANTPYINWNRVTSASAGTAALFQNASSSVGSITYTNTATAFNTSSDYRLKENIAPMTGALATVAQLKPCTYTWKVDGSAGQGFIAHELQAVVPDAVYGEKDAVDDDGNPVYQGVDTSFLVATLTAAIQELKAELDTVKAELATLKGQA